MRHWPVTVTIRQLVVRPARPEGKNGEKDHQRRDQLHHADTEVAEATVNA